LANRVPLTIAAACLAVERGRRPRGRRRHKRKGERSLRAVSIKVSQISPA
jgi:hypothetical protein